MSKKKRHIRYDRLALVVLIGFLLLGTPVFIIMGIQKRSRELTTVDVIQDGIIYTLNVDEFIEHEQNMTKLNAIKAEPLVVVEEEVVEEEPTLTYLGEYLLTGYCPCEICCGVWSGGPTYSGVMPQAQHTVAVDPDVIPLGTHLMINGIEYVAEDTGSAIIDKHIDIYCDTHEECFSAFCNGYAEVYLVNE